MITCGLSFLILASAGCSQETLTAQAGAISVPQYNHVIVRRAYAWLQVTDDDHTAARDVCKQAPALDLPPADMRTCTAAGHMIINRGMGLAAGDR